MGAGAWCSGATGVGGGGFEAFVASIQLSLPFPAWVHDSTPVLLLALQKHLRPGSLQEFRSKLSKGQVANAMANLRVFDKADYVQDERFVVEGRVIDGLWCAFVAGLSLVAVCSVARFPGHSLPALPRKLVEV